MHNLHHLWRPQTLPSFLASFVAPPEIDIRILSHLFHNKKKTHKSIVHRLLPPNTAIAIRNLDPPLPFIYTTPYLQFPSLFLPTITVYNLGLWKQIYISPIYILCPTCKVRINKKKKKTDKKEDWSEEKKTDKMRDKKRQKREKIS